jgi:hypothetical protein
MEKKLSRWFWLDAAMAVVSSFVLVLTLAWRDWIEIVFRVDPDDHSGSLESLVVMVCAVATITFIVLAHHEWRRIRVAMDGM